MHKATVRTLREFLGLTVADVAARAGVNPRTVQRWEAVKPPAESDIPDDIRNWLYSLLEWFNTTVDTVLGEVERQEGEQGGAPEVTNLSRYISDASAKRAGLDVPATCHAALQGYILATLAAEGYAVEVSWITPEQYGPH